MVGENSRQHHLANGCFDDADPFGETSWLDWDQFEAETSIGVVNFLKAHGVFKADAPCFARRNEAKVANEEDAALVDCFFLDTSSSAASNGERR